MYIKAQTQAPEIQIHIVVIHISQGAFECAQVCACDLRATAVLGMKHKDSGIF